MVEECGGHDWRTREEEPALALVPESEGVDADEVVDARLAPRLEGAQQKPGVSALRGLTSSDFGAARPRREFGEQLATVVNPHVRDQEAPAVRTAQRLLIEPVLRREAACALPQANRPAHAPSPRDCPVAARRLSIAPSKACQLRGRVNCQMVVLRAICKNRSHWIA